VEVVAVEAAAAGVLESPEAARAIMPITNIGTHLNTKFSSIAASLR
jgi:hypothetical protein